MAEVVQGLSSTIGIAAFAYDVARLIRRVQNARNNALNLSDEIASLSELLNTIQVYIVRLEQRVNNHAITHQELEIREQIIELIITCRVELGVIRVPVHRLIRDDRRVDRIRFPWTHDDVRERIATINSCIARAQYFINFLQAYDNDAQNGFSSPPSAAQGLIQRYNNLRDLPRLEGVPNGPHYIAITQTGPTPLMLRDTIVSPSTTESSELPRAGDELVEESNPTTPAERDNEVEEPSEVMTAEKDDSVEAPTPTVPAERDNRVQESITVRPTSETRQSSSDAENSKSYYSKLWVAIKNNHCSDIVNFLDLRPKALFFKDKRGQTPLHYAVDIQNVESVEAILQSRHCTPKVVNQVETSGFTALMRAARYQNSQIAKMLIDKGCNVTFNNRHGTALSIIISQQCTSNSLAFFRLLLEKRPNISDTLDFTKPMTERDFFFYVQRSPPPPVPTNGVIEPEVSHTPDSLIASAGSSANSSVSSSILFKTVKWLFPWSK